MSNLLEKASILTTPTSYENGKLLSIKPTNGDGDFSFTRGSSATRVNNQGLIEVVTETNLPRINYKNDKGSILMELQRTNNLNYSEQFDNAYWVNNGVTINPNQIISPDGNLTADLLTGVSGGFGVVVFSKWSSTNNAASCFAKKGSTNLFKISNASGGIGGVTFNVENGTITNTDSGFTGTIEDFGNGWYRCTAIDTSARSGTFSLGVTSATESVYLWGAQLEEDYTTSYIPTTSATVTRLAEVCIDSGDSSLINSTEGVLYGEISALADDNSFRYISLNDGSNTNVATIFFTANSPNVIRAIVISGGTTYVDFQYTVSDFTEFNKVALKYKANDFSLWINGVERATDTSGLTPIGLDSFDLGLAVGESFEGNIKSVAVFKEALSDDELTCLTS